MANNTKARYWMFLLYPESAPENWLDILKDSFIPFCVSPLHCFDKNPDGELKKHHWHVILFFSGPTTFNNVNNNFCKILNSPVPKYIPTQEALKGAYRYLTHKDNPEKYQYSESDIICSSNFSIQNYLTLSVSDEDDIYNQLEDYIFSNDIIEFCQLVFSLKSDDEINLLSFLRRHTLYFKELIKSYRYSK